MSVRTVRAPSLEMDRRCVQAAPILLAAQAWLQIAVVAALAAYPWLVAFGIMNRSWVVWLAALGLDALWLALSPAQGVLRRALLNSLSLAGLAGAAFLNLLAVYAGITQDGLGADYDTLASEIRSATLNPASAPPNLWFQHVSFIQNYFDPLTPLVNRLFDLTHDPFRLLAFHSAMILAGPLIVWWIASTKSSLSGFQFVLPVALLAHPALSEAMVAEYHQSEIGVGLLLLGTFWFFLDRGKRARSFVTLLLGTLIKISYWPSWFMFGLLSAFRRQWRWTAVYGATGVSALAIHQFINQGQLPLTSAEFIGYLGKSPLEVLHNVIFRPDLWLHFALQPDRWLFFGALLLPLGFCVLANPWAALPTLPLIILTLIDSSHNRAVLTSEYTTEYLGYLVGGGLCGLALAPRWGRFAVLGALTVGLPLTYIQPGDPNQVIWNKMTIARAQLIAEGYSREAAFSECAAGQGPVLSTYYNWVTYARETPDHLWVDQAESMPVSQARWDSFETLVSPHGGQWSIGRFPDVSAGYNIVQYQKLFDRLPVHVLTPRGSGWDYWGGQRLADCAARFDYEVLPPAGSEPPRETPTDAQLATYARSVGITTSCARAYVLAHGNQFPQTVEELTQFNAAAPANALCR